MNDKDTLKLVWVNVDVIKVPKFRLSSQMAKEEEVEFSESIKHDGVLNPIIVVEDNNGDIWLVDGANRLEVAKKFNQKIIPAILRRGTANDAIIGSALLNMKRGKVSPGILAEYIKNLIEDLRLSQQEIAEKLHISKSYVSMLYQIARNKEILGNLKSGKLTVDEAYEKAKNIVQSQGGSEHSSVTELCSKINENSVAKVQNIVEVQQPLTDGDLAVTESLSTKKDETKYLRCDFCGGILARDDAKWLKVHAHEYDEVLLILEEARKRR